MAIKTSYVLGAALAVIMVQALALYAMGRPEICPCGFVKLWDGSIKTVEDSQQVFDWYSLMHIAYGFVAYFLFWLAGKKWRWPVVLGLVAAVALSAGWEIYENSSFFIETYALQMPFSAYGGDSIVNSLADTALVAVGFWMASVFPVWPVLAAAVALEFILLLTVHDGVSVSSIAFIRSVASLLNWQAPP